MLWHPKTLQNLAMYNVFFIFGRFSIAGKLPKWPKIPFQYPLALRHPKILGKCRKHHRILVSVRNRFWGLVSVRNRFCPPPPAKADIATAILTNVIEHLVLLLPPNKHAFTAKAVWADLCIFPFPIGIKRCTFLCLEMTFKHAWKYRVSAGILTSCQFWMVLANFSANIISDQGRWVNVFSLNLPTAPLWRPIGVAATFDCQLPKTN